MLRLVQLFLPLYLLLLISCLHSTCKVVYESPSTSSTSNTGSILVRVHSDPHESVDIAYVRVRSFKDNQYLPSKMNLTGRCEFSNVPAGQEYDIEISDLFKKYYYSPSCGRIMVNPGDNITIDLFLKRNTVEWEVVS